jgi:hypothetical protein
MLAKKLIVKFPENAVEINNVINNKVKKMNRPFVIFVASEYLISYLLRTK